MARRFGRFNPNQKRDSKGRWTKGGGSSSKSKSKKSKSNYKSGRLSNGAILLTNKDPNRFSKYGARAGAVVGLGLGAVAGTPLAGAGAGLLAGSLIGNTVDQRVSRRRFNAAEAALRRRR